MAEDYSFGYVLVFSKDGTVSKGKKCRTKYDADKLASELALEFPDQLCVAMEAYTAYRSESKAAKVYLAYPPETLPVETPPAQSPPGVASLSGVSVTEDF